MLPRGSIHLTTGIDLVSFEMATCMLPGFQMLILYGTCKFYVIFASHVQVPEACTSLCVGSRTDASLSEHVCSKGIEFHGTPISSLLHTYPLPSPSANQDIWGHNTTLSYQVLPSNQRLGHEKNNLFSGYNPSTFS